MPFLCLHAASLDVTCNNNEKLLRASCSILLICFKRSLQLPEGSSLVSTNKSNSTSLSHSFFISIAIVYSLENSLMERLSSLVHLFMRMDQITKQNAILKKTDSLKTSSTTVVSAIKLLTQAVLLYYLLQNLEQSRALNKSKQRNLKQSYSLMLVCK